MTGRYYYSASVKDFLQSSDEEILGALAKANTFDLQTTQRTAWLEQITILRSTLVDLEGAVYFEYLIPRMGRRIDVVLLAGGILFVIEFKVGESSFTSAAKEQAWDYALDLKNFHEPSHKLPIIPILVATNAPSSLKVDVLRSSDGVVEPVLANSVTLANIIKQLIASEQGTAVNGPDWAAGRYQPTPTIIEAAMALYRGHAVEEISRSEAGSTNLRVTTEAIAQIIENSKANSRKAICFVTGVPGAGKTLVGLNIATTHIDKASALHSVFLSGNGPLVAVMREALARDKCMRTRQMGGRVKKSEALSEVKAFIQNVHHFRDECLLQTTRPPIEHVAIFDEAQRAWNSTQTSNFMKRKKGVPGFTQSEPEFLISCMNRHQDWAVIICLVGGGQEINTGEAGIGEWIESIRRSFPSWQLFLAPNLHDSEYGISEIIAHCRDSLSITEIANLHLSVSMRSFRAENVSYFVKLLLDKNLDQARDCLSHEVAFNRYPIVLTRNLALAKAWVRSKARGSERYGLLASSEAQRLKPYAIDVRYDIDPIHWFLDDKLDVRSSYYMEDPATEFHVQGLEVDWACVTWDADFRHSTNQKSGWDNWSFSGSRWKKIHQASRQQYQKNAYRVLLTRARQGMVVVVPEGDPDDHTRLPEYYDSTFEYLAECGIPLLD